MLALFESMQLTKWHVRLLMLAMVIATLTLIAMPKGENFAATDRLIAVMAMFAILLTGTVLLFAGRAKLRSATRRWRFAGASPAIGDTLSFVGYEEQLAARGLSLLIAGAILSFALYVLSYWPQCAALAPLRVLLGLLPPLFILLALVTLVRNRGHLVNAYFLRRYLRQQARHIGFRPRRSCEGQTMRAALQGAPVTKTGSQSFRAGGFVWQLDDFYKNTIVFGQTGSGKTVCVLNSLLEGLIATTARDPHPISGLILDPKGDFRGKVEALCQRYGRVDDLVILDPETWATQGRTTRSIAWNPLDNDDDALEVSDRLIATAKILGLEQGDQTFFLDSAKVFMQHGVTLLRAGAADGCAALADVHRLCGEPEGQPRLYQRLVVRIAERWPEGTIMPRAITDAIDYFEQEWAHMAPNQKSGVLGTVTQLLNDFRIEPFCDMFAGRSTITISEVIDQGKLLYIGMPSAKRERMAKVVNSLIKLEFARQVLLRPDKARPSFLLCDEFQTFFTSGEGKGDSDFFERSRQSRHANIVAAQNVSSFHKRTRNQHDVKNFLGNCAVKIFLRNTEQDTNRWASALFGERSEIVITTNEQASFDGNWSRRRHTSYNRSNQMVPVVPPEAFHHLGIPERDTTGRAYAEAIVHLASRGTMRREFLLWSVNLVL